ncbi:MAG: deoxyhypusine synthase [Planctomycetota bacterium]|nr:MAG: deoxyhypusine synthase [Planctomycetota bacterium]
MHGEHQGGERRQEKGLHDGYQDGLEPLVPLDLARCSTASELLRGLARTAFSGRALGEAAEVLEAMARDPDCLVVGTFSGAMTVAKMGLVLCDMIDHGLLDIVVSTGALMAHGFIEASGGTHFKYRPGMDDRELYLKGYDRVFDTLELERNLDDAELIVNRVLREVDAAEPMSSARFMHLLGRWLAEHTPEHERGILKSAYRRGVPVFVPAFSDSELGLDFALFNRRLRAEGKPALRFDPFLDLEDYTERCNAATRLGIFTIGGGVPRNWAQQVGPYLDIIDKRLGYGGGFKRFQYAVRICPEPVHWGGLSGCTYSEGVSWGKFVPPAEGGRWAEVPCDATIAWPLLVRAVLERLGVYGAQQER